MLICILAIVIYANSLNYPFILDDEILVVKNYLIRSWRFIPQIFQTDLTLSVSKEANFYRPLQAISYLLDYQIWQLDVFGYHFTNILLFIINGVLVYFLIHILSRDAILATLSALFFLTHPIYCEAVTYIAGRADILVAIFSISSLILFIQYSNSKDNKKYVLYLGSLIGFGLALLSKELALMLPLILILHDLSFKSDVFLRFDKFIRRYFCFIAITVAYIALRLTLLRFSEVSGATASFSLYKRLLIFLANFNLYFGILVFPFGLHISRTFLIPWNFVNLYVICGVVSLSLILSASFFYYIKNRQIFFWVWWFIIWLIPQSGIFPINSFFAEHFIYLSAIGFFVIAVSILNKFLRGKSFLYLSIITIMFFSYGTILHNRDWASGEIFYKTIIKYNPKSWLAHIRIGHVYFDQGFYNKAENEYLTALRIYPGFASAHANLAYVYINLGQPERAIIEIGKNLGIDNILSSKGKRKFPSKKEYLKVVRKDGGLVNIYNELGMLFSKHKLFDYARLAFEQAIRFAPEYPDVHWNLGSLYWQMGNYKEAQKEWELVLKIDPSNAYVRAWLAKINPQKP
ncbi:MAG: tetratricopeptide repeat protein [Candidatus Omnitrophota bacterium]|nr:tetratricopeptide repeat protein [Candidatus Omnitrophota bacterium]